MSASTLMVRNADAQPFSPQWPAESAIDQATFDQLRAEAHLFQRRVVRRAHLFRTGQPFESLYLVQSGQFRTSVLTEEGREKVTGFKLRGDLLGLDALGTATHPSEACALDLSQVYVVPAGRLVELCQRVPRLQSLVVTALASELRRDARWQVSLANARADQRVAHFLREFAERQRTMGFSASALSLRMTRADIGNFLGLTLESVTRCLSRLQQAGVLKVHWRDVQILDRAALDAATVH